MKQQTTPRLEKQAAMYGTRLKQPNVGKHDFKIQRTFFQTDSTTVLQWLYGGEKKQLVFSGKQKSLKSWINKLLIRREKSKKP